MKKELKHLNKFESVESEESDITKRNTLSVSEVQQMVNECIEELVEYFSEYIDDEVAYGNLDNIANIVRSISSNATTKAMLKMAKPDTHQEEYETLRKRLRNKNLSDSDLDLIKNKLRK